MGQTISIFYPASGGSDDWGYDIQLEANRYFSVAKARNHPFQTESTELYL